ncbi:MAG: nitroreductase family protein [Candidatus Hodarchaeota archaeon]
MGANRRRFFQQIIISITGLGLFNTKLLAKDNNQSPQVKSDDILKVIKERRSVRKFQSTPIPNDHLMQILEAANFAPTPRNRQAWKFLVIQKREIIDQIKEECIKRAGEDSKEYYTNYLSAPVYVEVLAYTETRNPVNDMTAAALAAENLMLAARAFGYGTVFCVNSIPEEITKNILNIPDDYKRICITPIGIPEEWPETPEKKETKEVVLYDKFE